MTAKTETDGFYFTVIDGEGGWIDQNWFEIIIDEAFSTSVDDLEYANDQLNIFPNPASDLLNLRFHSEFAEPIEIMLFDIHGKLLVQKKSQSNQLTQLSLDGFSEGLYLVRISTKDKIALKKLILHR